MILLSKLIMNKLVIFFISGVLLLLLVTCKTKKIEPVIVEKTLFENIEPCVNSTINYLNTNYGAIRKLNSDTILLKNVKGRFF